MPCGHDGILRNKGCLNSAHSHLLADWLQIGDPRQSRKVWCSKVNLEDIQACNVICQHCRLMKRCSCGSLKGSMPQTTCECQGRRPPGSFARIAGFERPNAQLARETYITWNVVCQHFAQLSMRCASDGDALAFCLCVSSLCFNHQRSSETET